MLAREFSRTHRIALGGAEVGGEQLRSALRRWTTKRELIAPSIRPYWTKYADQFQRTKSISFDQVRLGEDLDIIVYPDIHFSLHDPVALEEALDIGEGCQLAIVSGDLLDAYALSRFEKNHSGSLEDELEYALWFLERLSEMHECVLLVDGNHEKRATTQIARNLSPELLFLADQNILEFIARPFENVFAVGSWYVQVNDALICHANISSSQELKTARNIHEFFMNWSYKLGVQPYRVLVQSHIHRAGETYIGEVKLIESGCLCKTSDYRRDALIKAPEVQGVVTLCQRDGRSIQNSCRFFKLN